MRTPSTPKSIPARIVDEWKRSLSSEEPSAEAWQALLLELKIGAALFKDDEAASHLPPGLEGVMHFAAAIATFLGSSPVVTRERLMDPLGQLIHALLDLGRGRQPQLLTSVQMGQGGVVDSAAEVNLQVIAARALEELKSDAGPRGRSLAELAAEVASAVRAGRVPGYEKCTGNMVINWRKRARQAESGSAKVDASFLGRLRAPLPLPDSASARNRADFLLSALRNGRGFRWR